MREFVSLVQEIILAKKKQFLVGNFSRKVLQIYVLHFFPDIRASSSIAVPPDYRILIRAMKVVIWLTNYPLHMILIAGVVISADPLYPPIRSIICILSLSSIVFKLAAFLIRASLLTICLIVLFKAVNAFFIIGLMVVCSASEVLQVLNDLNPKRVVFSERNFQAREIKLYRQLLIWIGFTNRIFVILPSHR